jgi:hypothetical protein
MTTDRKDALIQKFTDRTAKIAVLGMGYVGLPLATVFWRGGISGDRNRSGGGKG